MSLLIANNIVQDSGHLVNAPIKSIIHNSTTSTCITTRNTHNLSSLIQNLLHVLRASMEKCSTWKTWMQEPTTLLYGTKIRIKDITSGLCNHLLLKRQLNWLKESTHTEKELNTFLKRLLLKERRLFTFQRRSSNTDMRLLFNQLRLWDKHLSE